MSAASFLSYGGVLKVVRADDDDLGNANAGVGIASTTVISGGGGLKIESFDDYQENHTSDTTFYYCLLYTSPSPRDISGSRMPSSA